MKSGRFYLAIATMSSLLVGGCTSNELMGARSGSSAESSANWQERVNELNEKITILSRWQQGYQMTAQQAQFKGDRIQFEDENIIDAKRLWRIAANASQKAQDLQVIIDQLVKERNAILSRHNQPIPKDRGFENQSSIDEQES